MEMPFFSIAPTPGLPSFEHYVQPPDELTADIGLVISGEAENSPYH
jgi:hypothetical protein